MASFLLVRNVWPSLAVNKHITHNPSILHFGAVDVCDVLYCSMVSRVLISPCPHCNLTHSPDSVS